jgi:hypothetical protein
MDRDEVVRTDFPEARPRFERRSVEAHLEAVAAHLAALKARVRALEVELEAVRGDDSRGDSPEGDADSAAPQPVSEPEPVGSTRPTGDEVGARLIATELVLGGVGRDEVVMRIAAEYDLADPGRLVDEVIARST